MKKIISLTFILILLASCSNTSGCKHHEERKYKEVICPKCNGTGTVPQTTSQKIGYAICTFGMTLMSEDEETCTKCHGKGYIKIPVLNDSIIVE